MLSQLLIAFCLMALCVVIHSMGLTTVFRWMQARPAPGSRDIWSSAWRLVYVAACTVVLHLAQIILWALCYAGVRAMPDLTTAAYFSAVTYTTTGYGDLVLPKNWRLVGGVEALTGILMCGLSTGMFFAAFSQIVQFQAANAPDTLKR